VCLRGPHSAPGPAQFSHPNPTSSGCMPARIGDWVLRWAQDMHRDTLLHTVRTDSWHTARGAVRTVPPRGICQVEGRFLQGMDLRARPDGTEIEGQAPVPNCPLSMVVRMAALADSIPIHLRGGVVHSIGRAKRCEAIATGGRPAPPTVGASAGRGRSSKAGARTQIWGQSRLQSPWAHHAGLPSPGSTASAYACSRASCA
jgi:hypothetical protein